MKLVDSAYCQAISQELTKLEAGLDRLRTLGLDRPLSEDETAALERYMQVLIDAGIGVAKRAAKQIAGHVPANTKDAFAIVRAEGLDPTELDWGAVIGMRNTIVHNYLDFDDQLLLKVVRNREYQPIFTFARSFIR